MLGVKSKIALSKTFQRILIEMSRLKCLEQEKISDEIKTTIPEIKIQMSTKKNFFAGFNPTSHQHRFYGVTSGFKTLGIRPNMFDMRSQQSDNANNKFTCAGGKNCSL